MVDTVARVLRLPWNIRFCMEKGWKCFHTDLRHGLTFWAVAWFGSER